VKTALKSVDFSLSYPQK